MDIKFLIEDYLKSPNIQTWINRRYKSPHKCLVDNRLFEYAITTDGLIYPIVEDLLQVYQASIDYSLEDLSANDIVIDIGANIGGFSLNAARICKHVLAVEPIRNDMLNHIISLNKIQNISVLNGALGDGRLINVSWGGETRMIRSYTLNQLKIIAGRCDFLKVDCEGWEWIISTDELKNIRRIEIELHENNPTKNNKEALINYLKENYHGEMTACEDVGIIGIFHGKIKL